MIAWIAFIAVLLALPGLALAGWRAGLRGREGGFLLDEPRKPVARIPYVPGEVRPRVRKAMYDRRRSG